MDNKHRTFAKMHLYNALLECQELKFTPEELIEALMDIDLPLVNNTMFILQNKKKEEKLLLIIRAMRTLISTSTILLKKQGYNVETEEKMIEYTGNLLQEHGQL